MKKKTLKEFLEERTETKINTEWHILTLDNGDELNASVKTIDKNVIQIARKGERKAETVPIKNGNVLATIEDYLGYKLPKDDPRVEDFLNLYPGCGN